MSISAAHTSLCSYRPHAALNPHKLACLRPLNHSATAPSSNYFSVLSPFLRGCTTIFQQRGSSISRSLRLQSPPLTSSPLQPRLAAFQGRRPTQVEEAAGYQVRVLQPSLALGGRCYR
ncbi:hypothetical protein MHYP_G00097570 [Metynnis hypsauchen]